MAWLGALLLGLLSAVPDQALAANRFAIASAAWNVGTTWSNSSGGATCNCVPLAGDAVFIGEGATLRAVTIPAGFSTPNVASVAIGNNALNGVSSLTLSAATATLNVAGAVTVNNPGNNNINVLAVGAGTANLDSLVLGGGGAAQQARISISTGNVNITNDVSITNTNSLVTFTGAGTLNVGGDLPSGGTFTANAGTVVYNGTGAGSVGSYTYNNLTVNKTTGTGIATTGAGTVTVGGALSVAGGTLVIAGTTFGVTGTTTISGGAAAGGTLQITSATGAKTFAAVTINNGTVPGVWDNSVVNAPVAMSGTLTNNGTFTSGTGTFTFTGNANWAGNNALIFAGNVIANTNTRTNAMTAGVTTTVAGSLSGTGAVTNGANQTLQIGGNATVTTLTATGVPNTVEYNGTAAQAGKTGGTYNNLIISSGGTVTFAANFSISGDLTDNGNFSHTAGTVTFNGAVAQNLNSTGTATNTTFVNLTLNNSAAVATRQLILNSENLTVTTLLTLTAGRITTGASNVYVSNGSNIGSAGGNDFVEGNLRKPYSGANLSRVFEVGNNNGTSKYTPVTLAFAAVSVAGDITVSTTNAEHPQIAASGIDSTNDVNRYWTITNGGVVFTTYTLTLNYIAGTPTAGDIDATATAAAFLSQRYDGTNWNATTLNAIPTTTQIVLAGVTAIGDFAVGEATGYNATLGRLNAYDTVGTPAGSAQGYIKTKISGTAFNSAPTSTTLTVVHLTAGALTSFGAATTVTVDLIDGTTTTAPFVAASNCWTNWTTATAIATGTINFGAAATSGTINFTVPDSYKNVRVRMTAGAQQGCSADAFAIRPSTFSVALTDQDWQTATGASPRTLNNITATGGVVHKAGQPFQIAATGQNSLGATTTKYYGTPTVVTVSLLLPTGCGSCVIGTVTPGTWSPSTAGTATGTVTTTTASYSDAGSFSMRLEDQSWANVDLADSSTAQRYVVGSNFNVGRFVPDHFVVTATGSAPQLQTFGAADSSCQTPPSGSKRSFTYIGQSFGYTAGNVPVFTFTGQNAANATTPNYTLTLIHTASITATQTYTPAPATLAPISGAPVVTAGTLGDGTGTVAVNASDTLAYVRSSAAPQASFNANISLTMAVSDASEAGASQGTITTSTTGTFSSIAFDSGNLFLYGRLRLFGAVGSERLALPIPVQTEFWNGTGFGVNTNDHCTTLANSNITMGNYQNGLAACNTFASTNPVTFVSGVGTLTLSASGSGHVGTVDLTPQLAATATGQYCTAAGASGLQASSVAAAKSYLQGPWGAATYDQNPTARAAFGIYGAQPRNFIFFRENY